MLKLVVKGGVEEQLVARTRGSGEGSASRTNNLNRQWTGPGRWPFFAGTIGQCGREGADPVQHYSKVSVRLVRFQGSVRDMTDHAKELVVCNGGSESYSEPTKSSGSKSADGHWLFSRRANMERFTK